MSYIPLYYTIFFHRGTYFLRSFLFIKAESSKPFSLLLLVLFCNYFADGVFDIILRIVILQICRVVDVELAVLV